jgi:thiol:disulfide interchange protein DsbD
MIRWLFPLLFLLLAPCCTPTSSSTRPSPSSQAPARSTGRRSKCASRSPRDYYLYRDKFRFAAEPATVQLGTAILPPGKEKHDETFGKVEVYYHRRSSACRSSATARGRCR